MLLDNHKVPVDSLRAICDMDSIDKAFSEQNAAQEKKPEDRIIGQNRALKALEFGLGIESDGFNIYVAGVPGTGKETAVKEYVEEIAKKLSPPDDVCYVNNFKDPYKPFIITLPSGKGIELAKDVKNLIDTAKEEIPRAFESDDYISQKESISKEYTEKKQDFFNELNEKALQEGFLVQQTPSGFVFVPKKEDGSPMKDEEIMSLSEEERKELQDKRNLLSDELKNTMKEIRTLDRKAQEEIKNLDQNVILFSVEHIFNDLMEKYSQLPKVLEYLRAMQKDIVENADLFRQKDSQASPEMQMLSFYTTPQPWSQSPQFKKYEVNVIVDNSETQGAPVMMEMNPTYQNIFGKIEKETQFGALYTDFTMIKPGSLHQANGGYFVVSIEDMLKNPFTWESLKRVLKNHELEIEEAAERLSFMSTKSLRPQPVPLNVKVILIGPPYLYYLLYHFDSEFHELFKVKAEFDDTMERNEQNTAQYMSFISTFCQKEKLSNLNKSALERIVEYGSRLAGDQKKLSTRFAEIADIIREACYYAHMEGADGVNAENVKQAIEAKIYRSNLIQEKIQELIDRDVLLIDTKGEVTGQINALSVSNIGNFSFGKPTRITCSIGLGRGGIIDIERESKLGGRIHTKGVMILSGYLSSTYAGDMPLTLSARLVFEQSYSEIDGDSASGAELCVLLSSLAEVPIKQDFAITGSVNQKGEIQAIGGVNEKIEGFYETCKNKGLTGNQGVIIPASNKDNLMLKEEIVEAVKEGKFNVFSVKHIDEAMEILTGIKAGEKLEDGTFEEDSINDRVQKSLYNLAIQMRNFGKDSKQEQPGQNHQGENDENPTQES